MIKTPSPSICFWSLRQGDSGIGFVQRKLSTERTAEFQTTDSFEPVDGAYDRVCRGVDPFDDDGSYYIVRGGEAAANLESCKNACVGTPGCRGIEFRPGRCEVWVRAGGIQATAVTPGPVCLRYVPFVLAAGAENRACRGRDQFDNNPAYYEITSANSLAACQDLCLQRNLPGSSRSPRCRGIEFGGNRCELWTRTEGIGASVELSGVVCQPLAPFVMLDAVERGCSARSGDNDEDFYTSYLNVSLQGCKAICAENAPFCKGVEFTSSHCHVWTRVSGIERTLPRAGAMCLRYGETEEGDAFERIDGGTDRACRGMNASDWSPSYFAFFSTSKSIEDCKSRCIEHPSCKGIESNAYGCKVWTTKITTSIGFSGTTCLRYSAFVEVDGGVEHGCFGVDPVETTALQFSDSVAEQCRSACVQTSGCQGVEYDEFNCEVWSSRIVGSYANVNKSCLRYEPFIAVGMNTQCRGMLPDDTWPSYYIRHVSTSDLSLQECKALCTSTTQCKGIQYDIRSGMQSCLVWKRRGGIQLSSDQSGSLCLRLGKYDPFEDSNAFVSLGHGTCIGGAFSVYDVSLNTCKIHCVAVPGCRGLDFGPAGCRIWHSEVTVNTTSESSDELSDLSECLSYEPFRDVDGGMGRDCRGSHSSDLESTYFVTLPATSLQACQDLCVQQAEADVTGRPCKGIAYDSATQSCRLWVRSQGIGATAEISSAVCQRYEPFLDLDGGSGRACKGDADAIAIYDTTEVSNLEHCRSLCVAKGCRGQQLRKSTAWRVSKHVCPTPAVLSHQDSLSFFL